MTFSNVIYPTICLFLTCVFPAQAIFLQPPLPPPALIQSYQPPPSQNLFAQTNPITAWDFAFRAFYRSDGALIFYGPTQNCISVDCSFVKLPGSIDFLGSKIVEVWELPGGQQKLVTITNSQFNGIYFYFVLKNNASLKPLYNPVLVAFMAGSLENSHRVSRFLTEHPQYWRNDFSKRGVMQIIPGIVFPDQLNVFYPTYSPVTSSPNAGTSAHGYEFKEVYRVDY